MKLISIPSPNSETRDGQAVDMLVLHYTGMKSAAAAMDKLINPTSKVSAHYVVDLEGQIFQLVDESMRAWHAGKSYWRGNTNINQRSIGIEIVNPGHEFGYVAFPEVQMQSVMKLCKDILSRHDIPAQNIVGHSDIAPTRKQDPGELFDWAWLAREGIGHWALGIRDILSIRNQFDTIKDGVELRVEFHNGNIFILCNFEMVDESIYHSRDIFVADINKVIHSESRAITTKNLLEFDLKDVKYIVEYPQSPITNPQSLAAYGYDTTDPRAALIAFQRHFRQKNIAGDWDAECAEILQHLLK